MSCQLQSNTLTGLKHTCCATRVIFVLFLPLCGSQSLQLTQQGLELVRKSGSSDAGVSRAAHQGPGRDG